MKKTTRRNISLKLAVDQAAEKLHTDHGVNISFECEKKIIALAKKFKVPVK